MPPQARSGFGPRFTATLAYLTALRRVTRRGCQEIAQTLFGIDISVGSVCDLHEEVSQAVESCCEQIKQALPREKALNVDETGWKSKGKRIWLWVFVAPGLALFILATSRGARVLRETLGQTFSGRDTLFGHVQRLQCLSQKSTPDLLGSHYPKSQRIEAWLPKS